MSPLSRCGRTRWIQRSVRCTPNSSSRGQRMLRPRARRGPQRNASCRRRSQRHDFRIPCPPRRACCRPAWTSRSESRRAKLRWSCPRSCYRPSCRPCCQMIRVMRRQRQSRDLRETRNLENCRRILPTVRSCRRGRIPRALRRGRRCCLRGIRRRENCRRRGKRWSHHGIRRHHRGPRHASRRRRGLHRDRLHHARRRRAAVYKPLPSPRSSRTVSSRKWTSSLPFPHSGAAAQGWY
jgi:hypothetical protein